MHVTRGFWTVKGKTLAEKTRALVDLDQQKTNKLKINLDKCTVRGIL